MKQVKQTAALVDRTWAKRSKPDTANTGRISFRLSDAELDQLVNDYVSGGTSRQLAVRYGLARSTVVGILRERGVAIRHPRISPADCARVVELYKAGCSQVDIAAVLGRSPGAIWHVLERAELKGQVA